MSPPSAHRLAWSNAALSLGMVAAALVLGLLALAKTGQLESVSHQLFLPVVTATFSTVGAIVAARHPRNPIGWMLSATGALSALELLALNYRVFGQAVGPTLSLPGVALAGWLEGWLWAFLPIVPMTFLLLLFPDGHLPSYRWRPVAWLSGVGLAGAVVGMAMDPSLMSPQPSAPGSSAGSPATGAAILVYGGWGLATVGIFGSVASLIFRLRRSRGTERDQLKWLTYAVGITIALAAVANGTTAAIWPDDPALTSEVGTISTSVITLGIILAVGVAIIRHRLYDIDLVINRTLVYGALTAAVVGIYVLVVTGLGVLLQARGSLALSLLGVGVVAIVLQPMRDRLQRAVNRLMYGERDDPYAALSRLGQRLEGTLAPEAVLPIIVETVAQTLKLPYAAIALGRASDPSGSLEAFPIVAAYGSLTPDPLHLPLVYQAEPIGALIVGPRAGEAFSGADRRLLDDLARQAGVAAHAVRLTADLQRSREQLVAAREEERRRLRRDLHDGLGSQFAALHLRADTLRALIPSDPAAAEAVAVELRDEIRAAVADIRRLVYALRPPALDELGLAGAIRALAVQQTSTNGLQVTVDAPEPLSLPAAVEVAAYRIAQEALANVARHARAHTCTISLRLGDDLRLEIKDDGIGLPPQHHAGVGLRSMRERAEELGGTCHAETNATGGTSVVARLPLTRSADRSPDHSHFPPQFPHG